MSVIKNLKGNQGKKVNNLQRDILRLSEDFSAEITGQEGVEKFIQTNER